MTLTLHTEIRTTDVDNESLRGQGRIPAVFYGPKDPATSISISYADFIKIYKEAGESTVITLETPAGKKSVLVQDFQIDPVSDKVFHVDFKVVEANKPLEVTVPLEFEGEAPAARSGLGVVTKVLHELEIRALPKDLPHNLTVSIASLDNADSHILAGDIVLPAGVELMTDPEAPVVVIARVQEEDESASGPIDFSQIEVAKKGKTEEESTEESA